MLYRREMSAIGSLRTSNLVILKQIATTRKSGMEQRATVVIETGSFCFSECVGFPLKGRFDAPAEGR